MRACARTRVLVSVSARSSSNRLWAFGCENFYEPAASKICLPHNPTATCKGNDHGLTPKLNIYTKNIIKQYIFQNSTIKYISFSKQKKIQKSNE